MKTFFFLLVYTLLSSAWMVPLIGVLFADTPETGNDLLLLSIQWAFVGMVGITALLGIDWKASKFNPNICK